VFNVSTTFNVFYLQVSFLYVGNDSRSNFFKERGNDENQHATLQDPLHVLIGPITREYTKRIKIAIKGLIHDI